MVNILPPALIVPVRALKPLASILNEMSPLPVPEFPLVMVMNESFVKAFQVHPAPVVRLNVPWPAPDPKFMESGKSENVHGLLTRKTYALMPPINGEEDEFEPSDDAVLSEPSVA